MVGVGCVKVVHILLTLIKKFAEFIQEIQNTSLFIKIDIAPFKVLPIYCNALLPTLDPVLETFMVLVFRYSHQSRLRFFHHLLSAAETRSRSGFLTRSNRKQSQGDKADEFGSCWMVFVPFLVKNSRIMMALCDGALS